MTLKSGNSSLVSTLRQVGKHPDSPQYTDLQEKVNYTKHVTSLTNATKCQAFVTVCHCPLLFSSRSLGFVCASCICCVKWLEMKEWSSLEKQVFSPHYFLTMPHLVQGSCCHRLPANWGTNTRREADGEKWDGMGIGGMSWADTTLTKTTRLKTCVGEKKKKNMERALKTSRFHTDPRKRGQI